MLRKSLPPRSWRASIGSKLAASAVTLARSSPSGRRRRGGASGCHGRSSLVAVVLAAAAAEAAATAARAVAEAAAGAATSAVAPRAALVGSRSGPGEAATTPTTIGAPSLAIQTLFSRRRPTLWSVSLMEPLRTSAPGWRDSWARRRPVSSRMRKGSCGISPSRVLGSNSRLRIAVSTSRARCTKFGPWSMSSLHSSRRLATLHVQW
mmetsp:Transcript_59603/g.151184  ORF Transcript_59603/g.151184 Transcript_59603/m.151184 type:complete len:207 (-) Transcript_59603:411-1031(-)